MHTIEVKYPGNLRTVANHLKSGSEIETDAPIDNNGKGEKFSPTDLVAASLGSCMLTVVGIAAATHGFSIDGAYIEITKIMGTNPRRIIEIIIKFYLPEIDYSEHQKIIVERTARTCPVANSLHPEIVQNIEFIYSY